MGPSFSSKNGVRYRFYVSTALRGRKHKAGSITRISAPEIEALVEMSLREQLKMPPDNVLEIQRVVVSADKIQVTLKSKRGKTSQIEIPWAPKVKGEAQVLLAGSATKTDQKLLKAIVRAHAWLKDLATGRYTSIEDLADAANLHPKVVRQGLRLAFLSPELTANALSDESAFELKKIPKRLPLAWQEHGRLLA
jgi:hypothetical protein